MILTLISNLYNLSDRHNASIKLANYLDAIYVLPFIKDPEIDIYLPSPGFTQTLYGSNTWDDFLSKASIQTHNGILSYPDKETLVNAIGMPGPEESVIVILGTTELSPKITPLFDLLPLLIALFKQEQALLATKSITTNARRETSKAEKLAAKLDIVGQNLRKSLIEQQNDKESIKQLMLKKDEFMNIASHELKTPITSMKAYLQIITKKILPAIDNKQLVSFVEKSNKQVDKLIVLINDLLDVSKIQAGKMHYTATAFNLIELLNNSVDESKSISSTHKIIVNAPSELKISGDRMRLEQVLTNLLSNAIKYSPDAETVIIDVNEEDTFVKVSITDFGIGISEKQLPFLFDRFFRVENNENKFFGLGLGLYISSEIVKRHNGEIKVESNQNRGSKFWFKLPYIAPF